MTFSYPRSFLTVMPFPGSDFGQTPFELWFADHPHRKLATYHNLDRQILDYLVLGNGKKRIEKFIGLTFFFEGNYENEIT